jgi:phage terminase large subunit-like protein
MARPKKSPSRGLPRSVADEVTRYAEDVVSGKIVAGPHVRDACKRHLRDLKEGPKRGLRWDVGEAKEAFRFYSDILRLNGGEFEGKPFELHPSQKFIVGSLFGWKAADGHRRFRVAYIEQAKGNGKSPLVAGIGLRMLVADGEPRAEVYAAATKKDQAQILFRDAVAMIDQSPELDGALERSGGRGKEWNIADLATASFFRTVASDDAQSGPRPHCALLDEIHEHKTGLMVEMMRAGTKGRRQALIVMITNSGTDKQSVCWSYHEYAAKVCAGLLEDDGFFGYVCALDPDDDPMVDSSCWIKANPLLGVSIPKKYLEEQIREAKGMPAKESTVRRLNFCQWVEAENPLFSPDIWRRASDPYNEEFLRGRKCYGGLDLSSTTALTAFVLLFEPSETDPKWRLRSRFWIPSENFSEWARKARVTEQAHAWRAAGWLTTTPGAAVNKLFVLAELVGACAAYDVQSIGFDRWRIEDLKSLMADEGVELPLEPFGQGFKDMSPALDEFERFLISDEMRHDGNPVMNWNVSNAIADSDPAGNRKVAKDRATGPVDGVVAGIMAAGRSLAPRETPTYQMLFV